MQVELLDAGEGRICASFKRKSGSTLLFYTIFNDIRNKLNIIAATGATTPTWC